jgi:hypothetical protein
MVSHGIFVNEILDLTYFFTMLSAGQEIQFPALSPTMTHGKLIKWNVKEGL